MISIPRFLALTVALLSATGLHSAIPSAVARWEFSAETTSTWTEEHKVCDKTGAGTLSFEGAAPKFHRSRNGSISVSNVKADDCFLLSAAVPVLPKDTEVDMSVYLGTDKEGGPGEWACEYFDGKTWQQVGEFTVKKYEQTNETCFVRSFQLNRKLKGGSLQVRVRCMKDAENPAARAYLMPSPRYGAYLAAWPKKSHGSLRVLILGNSATYFGGSYLALMEIAHSQGNRISMGVNLKGGQTFGQHLKLERTLSTIAEGNYDAAILQDHSGAATSYVKDPVQNASVMENCKILASQVRKFSPSCRLILEHRWAMPKNDWYGYGSAEAFDADLTRGTALLAEGMQAEMSPLGPAFALGREAGLPLYWKDNAHPSVLGAYLKACVNYLVLFGEPFVEPVSDYGLDPAQAAKCREIAEKIVFKR